MTSTHSKPLYNLKNNNNNKKTQQIIYSICYGKFTSILHKSNDLWHFCFQIHGRIVNAYSTKLKLFTLYPIYSGIRILTNLTRCGPMIPYGNIDLGQHWLR